MPSGSRLDEIKALAGVNQEQLALYYGIGRYISKNSRGGFWGKDAIETISRQLSAELPGLKGFSARNLRNMRTFYEEWRVFDSNLAVTTAKSQDGANLAVATAKLNTDEQLMVFPIANVPVAAFFSIGFTHHTTILSKVKTQEERYFYIQLCHDRSLTVDELEQQIAAGAYAHRAQMPNNFTKAIADYKQAYQRPMGVATYRTSQEQLRELLPDEEEMKRLMGKNEDKKEENFAN